MTRKLLIVFIGGGVIAIAAFALLDQVGGFEWHSPKSKTFGPQVTRDLPWTGTETLHLDNSAATVTYIQGPTPKFTVTGPADRVNALSISGDTVTGTDIRWGFTDDHEGQIRMTVTGPNTHAFFLSGAEHLQLQNYDQDSLDLHLSGAATVKAQGKAKHATVDMSGAGHLDMREFPVDDAKVGISGAGSAIIDPHVSADVSISGAGHVKLLTRPTTLKTSISGVGSITSPRGTTATIGAEQSDDSKESKSKDKNDKEDD
jgi:hypothetical protein